MVRKQNKTYDYNESYKSTKMKLVWPFTSNAGRENGKKVYKWKPMLTRPPGRPKNRWEDYIINDMKKLKMKNWTSCIQDRNKWKLYVEKAKTLQRNEVVAPKEEEELSFCLLFCMCAKLGLSIRRSVG